MKDRVYTVIGLMSGTSMDGVDAALLRTDGGAVLDPGPWLTLPYDEGFRGRLRGVLGGQGTVAAVEAELTDRHAEAVRRLLLEAGLSPEDVDLLGFHGQTILHDPAGRRTWQIGDGRALAAATGIPVVNDFRSADVAAGGQGAPLAPLYHRALSGPLPGPLAVLNLGGVGNVTWIGDGEGEATDLLAFDTGPGNALIDDWMLRHTGQACDRGGAAAAKGRVDGAALARWLTHPFLTAPPPKSLDRDAFARCLTLSADLEDGAATLTAFTAATVAAARSLLPIPPRRWLVTGGGRHNPTLMAMLAERLACPVDPVEAVGWSGDALEAQAFAYLAVRSVRGLPLSVPGTTGVAHPTTGGRLHAVPRGAATPPPPPWPSSAVGPGNGPRPVLTPHPGH